MNTTRPNKMRLSVFSSLMAAVVLLVADPAGAGEGRRPAGVVELFTSQSCNSCPPADALLAELAQGGNVVALAYHVDYWDYHGWRDTFGSPDNTRRQHEYRQALGERSVYTPQAVVNGRLDVNGAKREKVMKALEVAGGLTVDVSITQQDDRVVIETGAGPASYANLVIVFFEPPTAVSIGRGENSGRTISYWNAVSEWQIAGMWHGKPARIELPASEIAKKATGGYAVLVQEITNTGLPGAIIGAAIARKPTD
jgi:hypothetical protein